MTPPDVERDGPLTPEALDAYQRAIELLRVDALLGFDASSLCPEAETQYLLALDMLSAARRFVLLALFAQRRALTGGA